MKGANGASNINSMLKNVLYQSPIRRFWRFLARSYLTPKHIATRIYYAPRFTWPIWFYLLNRQARKQYTKHPVALSQVQEQAVQELRQNGICILQFDELFKEQLADYQELAESLINTPQNQQRIVEAKKAIEAANPETRSKYYLVEPWGNDQLDPQEKFVQLALSDEILAIVNGYVQVFCRLNYLRLWYNLPMGGPSISSQNWHRDPEDRKIVKLFFYLRDVEETTGPFYFIEGTHCDGPYAKVFPKKPPYGYYPSTVDVEKKFKDTVKTCTGPAGTIVICDTSGLHKGGHATMNARLLFNAIYTSDATSDLEGGKVSWRSLDHERDSLSPMAKYAVGSPRSSI